MHKAATIPKPSHRLSVAAVRNASAFSRIFTFPAMVAMLLVAGVYLCSLDRNMLSDPDIWWHLRNAQYLLTSHTFLRRDIYTFTINGKPWLNPEWLSEIPYFAAWKLGGYRGIYLLTVGMIEVLALGVCALAWQQIQNIKAAAISCIAFLMLASVSLAPRTQLFGWACLLLELCVIERYRKGRDHLWLLPVVFAAWINLHGSWPVGLLFFAIHVCFGPANAENGHTARRSWFPSQRQKLSLILGISIAALFANPYGWRLVAYPFQIAFTHHLTTSTVAEWQSLDFHGSRGKFLFTALAALLLLSMLRKRRWNLAHLLVLLIATLAAFTYSRFLFLEAIVLPPLLARELTFFSSYRREIDKPWLNAGIVTLMVAFIATHVPAESALLNQARQDTPFKAVEFLKTNRPAGNLLNDFNWGGYLVWNLPDTPVFIDSRADAFEQSGIFADYMDAIQLRRPLEVLDKYNIDTVLMPRTSPISYLLRHDSGWTVRYEDGTAVVMQRANRRKSSINTP
jgi:hypothetical protein